jgi:soluble lytic murein transglycosylase-like protein
MTVTQPGGTPATLAAGLQAAAQKYGVPLDVLTGVFGMETNFGSNHNTSSAGAMGYMQFMPATAAQYGYPLTDTPSLAQAQQQFYAAADKLATDAGPNKNWSQAVAAYGGGYTLAQVLAKAKQAGNLSVGSSYAAGALPSIPNPVTSVGNAISGALGTVVGDAKYAAVFVGALLVGAVLMFRAFSSSGGTKVVPVPV